MKKRQMGNSNLRASGLGLGCMGMSEWYGPTNDKESIYTIRKALDSGLNFFDTADVYGNGHNETLLGKALGTARKDAIVASKFGYLPSEAGICGRPEYAKQACEASLKRLGTDHIDLYYLHRIDPEVPLEDSMGAMHELVNEGKVRYLGLSEVSAASLRKASAIHPITALQSEYSIWVRDIEGEIIDACRQLHIAIVPYSPLGRGFLAGKLSSADQFGDDDYRKHIPMFQGENFISNLDIVKELENIAVARRCKPAQVALAWLSAQGEDIFPIPGTKRVTYLEENMASLDVSLSADEIDRINEVSRKVKGQRKNASGMKLVNA